MSLQAPQKSKEVIPIRRTERSHRSLSSKDFLSVLDLRHTELESVLALAAEMKKRRATRASRPISRWPAATSRCSSRSRRFGRAPRS